MSRAKRRCVIRVADLDRFARQLPEVGYYLVWDADARNLALSVQRTGKLTWFFIYSFGGRAEWRLIGDARDIPPPRARVLAAELREQVRLGRNPRQEQRDLRSAESFGDIAHRYIRDFAMDNRKSWRQTQYFLGRLPRGFRELGVRDVTRRRIKDALWEFADAPGTARQVLAAVSRVLSWAVEEEMIDQNPALQIKRMQSRMGTRVLDAEEIRAFWHALGECGDAGRALRLLLLTGQRPGEVAALRLSDVRAKWWTMPGEPDGAWPGTKNGQDHAVWIPAAALSLLPSTPTLNPARLKTAMWRAMRRISQELGVRPATSHDLRRTHGTLICELIEHGDGEAMMHRIQNHSRGALSTIYNHARYKAKKRRVMELVASHIVRLVEGPENNVIDLMDAI
jgi:integrase